MSKALDGVKILDFTHVQSGPTCTQLLAWFGADVIKVERPGTGDITRGQLQDIPKVDSLYFTMLNHNTRSITVDSKHPKGKEVIEALIQTCDVLVENFAPGALDRMGFAIAATVETGQKVLAIEGDSAFGFSGMEVETICRYNLPVCIVVFNNDGIYRGDHVNPSGGSDAATTAFVKGARYDKMIEGFGGVGVNATTPDELKRAVDAAMDSGKPTLINAVIDPAAGSESGNIGNLNPKSALTKQGGA